MPFAIELVCTLCPHCAEVQYQAMPGLQGSAVQVMVVHDVNYALS